MSRSILPRVLRAACTLALLGMAIGTCLVVYRAASVAFSDDPSMASSYGVDIGVAVHDPSWTVLNTSQGEGDFVLSDLHGRLIVTSQEPRQILVGLLLSLPALLISVVLVLCLRRLLDDVLAGQPFSARSIRLLRLMGGLLLFGQLVVPFVSSWLSLMLIEDLAVVGATVTSGWTIQFDKLVVACLPLVLAEVFQHGSAIESEQSLTV